MLRLIYRYVVPLFLLLLVGIVAYNYFFGNEEERESSIQIVSQVQGLGSNVVGLLYTEKGKYDSGKYDDALDTIGTAITTVKGHASALADGGQEWLTKLNELEQQKQGLEDKLKSLNSDNQLSASGTAVAQESEQLESEIEILARQTEQLGMEISQR